MNTRVLVIDDEEIVRNTVKEILSSRTKRNNSLENAEAALFGDTPGIKTASSEVFNFSVDCAGDGESGWKMVRESVSLGRPYALAFIDMRMPRWNGLETAKRIREIDHKIEIVFLTAFSDYSIEEVVSELGHNIGYHCKPFESIEILQIATKLCYEWAKLRDLEELIEAMGSLNFENQELSNLKANMANILTSWLSIESMLIYSLSEDSAKTIVTTGWFLKERNLEQFHTQVNYKNDFQNRKISEIDENTITYRYNDLYIFIKSKNMQAQSRDRHFLAQLFLENVSKTIENFELQKKSEDQKKLAMVGEAISKVAHDLRMPAGFPLVAIELIEEEPEDTEQTKQMFELMKRSSIDMQNYLNDILDFAKDMKIEKEVFSIEHFARDLESEFNLYLKAKNVRCRVECQSQSQLNADKYKLKRAVQNISRNSFEAVASNSATDARVDILFYDKSDDHIAIDIKDNGNGIPEEILVNIFSPFVTSGKESGTGLGCAVAKQVVDLHEGDITISSSSGGTTFTMIIPKALT